MMYTNLAIALALFGVGAQAQGFTCPAGQTYFTASSGAPNRCCPTTLLNGCTLSSDSTSISCTFGVGTALSWMPGVNVPAQISVAGAKGQDISGAQADKRSKRAPRLGGQGGQISASFNLKAALNYEIRVGREGTQTAGNSKGVRWGEGGGYSAFISSGTLPRDNWAIVGAGGGGAGNQQNGGAATGDNLGACKAGPGPGGVPTINPNGNTNRGGGGAGCPGGNAAVNAGSGGKAGRSAAGLGTSNVAFANSDAALITITFPCEEVIFIETTVSATVTNTAFTTIDTVYTAPPTSTVTENETPPVSTIKETTTATQTYPTSVITETSTPPTIFETITETSTSTPDAVETQTTTTPDAVDSISSVKTTITPATRTDTSIITSSTGTANCLQFRMVYPASCCPNTYIGMTGRFRHRRRGLHGGALDKRIITGTLTDGISTSSVTDDATATLEGETPISTLTETAATPLFTESFTDTSTLETPLTTTTTVVDAPLATQTDKETTTLDPVTNVETIEAPTPTNTIFETETSFAPTPVTTTTTTAFARSTNCAIQIGATQSRCPAPGLAQVLDRTAQRLALIAKKTLSGRQVIVDCGTAGQYLF